MKPKYFFFSAAVLAAGLVAMPLAMAASATTGGTASAQGSTQQPQRQGGMHPGWHGGMHPGWHGQRGDNWMSKLDLSSAQRDSIRKLMQENREQSRGEWQGMMEAQKAYRSATPGTSDYRQATQALANARADMARQQVEQASKLRAEIWQQLTPEQRSKLTTLRSEQAAKWHGERERHGQGQGQSDQT